MSDRPLPALIEHLLEAFGEDDSPRVERILRKAERRGEVLIDELERAEEALRAAPRERAGPARGVLMLLAAATRSVRGREFVLRWYAGDDPDEHFDEVLDMAAEDPVGWTETALSLLPAAVAERDDDLVLVCTGVLGEAEPGTPGMVAALLAALPAYPVDAVGGLSRHDDPEAGPALLDWVRALPDPRELSAEASRAGSLAAGLLREWATPLTPADLSRAAELMERENADMVRTARRLKRRIARNERRLEELATRRPRDRTIDRRVTGPNAPCECGSGEKAKRCCG